MSSVTRIQQASVLMTSVRGDFEESLGTSPEQVERERHPGHFGYGRGSEGRLVSSSNVAVCSAVQLLRSNATAAFVHECMSESLRFAKAAFSVWF